MKQIQLQQMLCHLRTEVERKAGFSPSTPHDFAMLSDALQESGAGYLSESTLKRLWGYADAGRTPHKSTLDILCRYVSGKPFQLWFNALISNGVPNSGFFSESTLNIEQLSQGDLIKLTWKPDRVVTMRFLDNYLFEVVGSEHSRLQPGWLVKVPILIDGQPMIVDVSSDCGTTFRPYVAGRSEGISWKKL